MRTRGRRPAGRPASAAQDTTLSAEGSGTRSIHAPTRRRHRSHAGGTRRSGASRGRARAAHEVSRATASCVLRAAAAGWARARAGRHLRGAWSGLRGRRCHGVNAAAPANASHFRWHGAPSTAWCLTRELSRRGKRSHSHGGSTKGPSDHYHRTARARSQREAQADCQLNRQELPRRTVCLVSVRVRASVRACSCARPRPSSMGAKRRADRTRSETSLPRACCPYADRRCVHQARPLPRQVKRRACALARQARACASTAALGLAQATTRASTQPIRTTRSRAQGSVVTERRNSGAARALQPARGPPTTAAQPQRRSDTHPAPHTGPIVLWAPGTYSGCKPSSWLRPVRPGAQTTGKAPLPQSQPSSRCWTMMRCADGLRAPVQAHVQR